MSAALDQSPEPHDLHVPIGAEYWGKARDMRRRIAVEDREYDRLVDVLIQPVKERLRRCPGRSLRPEMLIDLVQSWRFMSCRDWRLSLDASLEKHRASLIEHRLVAGTMRRPDDPDWRGLEEDLACVRVELLDQPQHRAPRKPLRRCYQSSCHCPASTACAGRRHRSADARHQPAVQAASGEALTPGAGYVVTTHPDGGGWRGRAIRQTGPGGVSQTVLSIRTWL